MIKLSDEQQGVLVLIQNTLWQNNCALLDANWELLEKTAEQQGVLWMLHPGAKAYAAQIPAERIRAWRAKMISSVLRNDDVNAVQAQVIAWLRDKGIRTAVLKGQSCSAYYPLPEIRALGDIDLLIDKEKLPLVGEYLMQNGFQPAENEHLFHVGYSREGVTVEVHYAVNEFPDSKGGRTAQEIAKRFLDETRIVNVNGMSFPVLSDSHQALMLLMHMEKHMIISGIGLRQLCDWATFVNCSEPIHWKERTLDMLDRCGLLTYAKVVTKTCVNYLGLNSEKAAWCMDVRDDLAESMLKEVFRSGNMGAAEHEHTSDLFFDRAQLGRNGQSRLTGFLMQLSKLAYKHFPFTKKWKILLPFFWVYLPLRYLVRSMLGLRPKKNALKLFRASETRSKLYSELKLYMTKG